jgi:protein-S-isoprenylcysteine O-methyltransferase Ste14
MNRWILPPVAFAIAAVGMWVVGRAVDLGRYDFRYQGALAIGLVVLGLLVIVVSLRIFASAGTTANPAQPRNASELVTSGVYSLSRNPMYVGDAVMLAGIAVWVGSVLNLVLLAAFIAYIDRVQIAAEEQALAAIFGDRYAAYCRRVRRWL